MAGQNDFHTDKDELQQQWAMMSASKRSAAWERFTQEIDEGCAGWNRYHPILWPAYELGMDILQISPG